MNEHEALVFLGHLLEGVRSPEVNYDQHRMLELLRENGISEGDLIAAHTIEVHENGGNYTYPQKSTGLSVYTPR